MTRDALARAEAASAPDSLPVPTSGALQGKAYRAALLLASGETVAKAAREAGIHRATLYRWKEDPSFLAYLETASREIRQAFAVRRGRIIGEALRVMEEGLRDPSPGIRLAAAGMALKRLLPQGGIETMERHAAHGIKEALPLAAAISTMTEERTPRPSLGGDPKEDLIQPTPTHGEEDEIP